MLDLPPLISPLYVLLYDEFMVLALKTELDDSTTLTSNSFFSALSFYDNIILQIESTGISIIKYIFPYV
jgi:hypothetical protein